MTNKTLRWETSTYGFLGSALVASMLDRKQFQIQAAHELRLSSLYLLTQVHSDKVVVYKGQPTWDDLPQGDAIVAPIVPETRGAALGILTADCVPLLVKSNYAVAAIHAGWRGLAAGVIEQAIATVLSFGNSSLEVKIGPCAGPRAYEVGTEVVAAIGKRARYEPRAEKFLLQLQKTAAVCVETAVAAHGTTATIDTLEICTISSKDFHSYRRDGNAAGRNLSYVLVQ